MVVLVLGSREQIHEAFDVIKLERMQDVTCVVRDPKKPDKPEEREEETHLSQRYRWRSHRSGCGRFHGENDISFGSSCAENVGTSALKKPCEVLGGHKTRMSRSL